MSKKVKGWDTAGIASVGILDDGRINMQFRGKEGADCGVFIPPESAGHLIISLQQITAAIEKMKEGTSARESLPIGVQFAGVKSIALGSSDGGTEIVLKIASADNTVLQYLLNRNTFELLATGCAAIAQKHGIDIQLQSPVGRGH